MTVLVVLPLQVELDSLTAGLAALGCHVSPLQIGRIGARQIPTLDLTLAHGGHGKTQFAVQTQHLLDALPTVAAVVCCGVAGALASDLAIGDPVLATETVEHDDTERFIPRFPGDPALPSGGLGLPLQPQSRDDRCGCPACPPAPPLSAGLERIAGAGHGRRKR